MWTDSLFPLLQKQQQWEAMAREKVGNRWWSHEKLRSKEPTPARQAQASLWTLQNSFHLTPSPLYPHRETEQGTTKPRQLYLAGPAVILGGSSSLAFSAALRFQNSFSHCRIHPAPSGSILNVGWLQEFLVHWEEIWRFRRQVIPKFQRLFALNPHSMHSSRQHRDSFQIWQTSAPPWNKPFSKRASTLWPGPWVAPVSKQAAVGWVSKCPQAPQVTRVWLVLQFQGSTTIQG